MKRLLIVSALMLTSVGLSACVVEQPRPVAVRPVAVRPVAVRPVIVEERPVIVERPVHCGWRGRHCW